MYLEVGFSLLQHFLEDLTGMFLDLWMLHRTVRTDGKIRKKMLTKLILHGFVEYYQCYEQTIYFSGSNKIIFKSIKALKYDRNIIYQFRNRNTNH